MRPMTPPIFSPIFTPEPFDKAWKCHEDDHTPRKQAIGSLVQLDDDDSTPREHMSDGKAQELKDALATVDFDDVSSLAWLRDMLDARCKELEDISCQSAMEREVDRLPNVPFVHDGGKAVTGMTALGDWDIGREIGAGAYAKVYSAINRTNGRTEAVKVILKSDLISEEEWVNARNEVEAYGKVGEHPNLAWLVGALQSQERIYFFTAFAKGKDLFSFLKLRQQNTSGVPKEAMQKIFSSVSKALAHCHGRTICHRDLKPENVVVNQDYSAMLVDFGCACPRFHLHGQCVGTMPFIAPECLRGISEDGASADMWSLGVLLMEMAYGLRALPKAFRWQNTEVSLEEQGSQLVKCFSDPAQGLAHVRSALGVKKAFEGDESLVSMLHVEPNLRPSAEAMLESAWLGDYAVTRSLKR